MNYKNTYTTIISLHVTDLFFFINMVHPKVDIHRRKYAQFGFYLTNIFFIWHFGIVIILQLCIFKNLLK